MQATQPPASSAVPRRRAPLDADQIPRREGQVFVIQERCKGCSLCVDFCPIGVLELSPSFNVKGYHPPRVIHAQAHHCVSCGFCTLVCPEYAIYTTPITTGQEAPK